VTPWGELVWLAWQTRRVRPTLVRGVRATLDRARAAILIAVAAGCLTACAATQVYSPPVVDVPAAFKEDANWKPAQPADVAARGAWWDVFGDTTLGALEAQIAAANPDLQAAAARFDQARAALRGSRALRAPQVTGVPSIVREQPSGNRAISSSHDAYTDLVLPADVSYEADVWGRVRQSVRASRGEAEAAAADVAATALSLQGELAVDYFALRTLEREEQLLADTVSADEQALQLTQNRFRGGLVSQFDVAQAETQLEATRADALDVGIDRASLEHAIAALVGRPASTFTVPAGPLAATPPSVPPVLPSQLLERRPDVAAAERRVASTSAGAAAASAALYPIVSLSGSVGFESSSFGSWLAAASNFWSIAPAAAINVFDAGRRHAVADQARARYVESMADYRQSVLAAFREVEDQLSTLRILESESRVQDAAVAAAQQSLTLANNRYRGGVATYLEVIAAQNAALANERAAVTLLGRRMTATVRLMQAIGGGWDRSAIPAALARTN
jgi:NodT family efflux transporter outer membrane factor (OMF) lipoprotein